MQKRFELTREVATIRFLDELFQGRHQGSKPRKPDGLHRPQAVLVEMHDRLQRVVSSTVRVACLIGDILEHAKDSQSDIRLQDLHELINGRDALPLEHGHQLSLRLAC